jgi:hypothetical protein
LESGSLKPNRQYLRLSTNGGKSPLSWRTDDPHLAHYQQTGDGDHADREAGEWEEYGMTNLIKIDVKGIEEWREYDFSGRVYRIDNPVSVEFRHGGSTHRVTDLGGIVHCLPAPGNGDTVLRWKGPVIA